MIRAIRRWIANIISRFRRAGGKTENFYTLRNAVKLTAFVLIFWKNANLQPAHYDKYCGIEKLWVTLKLYYSNV